MTLYAVQIVYMRFFTDHKNSAIGVMFMGVGIGSKGGGCGLSIFIQLFHTRHLGLDLDFHTFSYKLPLMCFKVEEGLLVLFLGLGFSIAPPSPLEIFLPTLLLMTSPFHIFGLF